MKINIEAAKRLRELRFRAGYEHANDFANKYGLPEVTYRSHENGSRNLTLRAAKKYAQYLDTSYRWILDGVPDDLINSRSSEERTDGILSLIEIIFAVLTARRLIKDTDLEAILSSELKNFQRQNQPGAIEVLEELKESVNQERRESKIQAIRKLLPPDRARLR